MDRLEALVRRTFFHPKIRVAVRSIVSNCPISPMVRTTYKPYGALAPREASIAPWSEVHVDCIGSWKVQVPSSQPVYFYALTCIDPVTNLIEIICFEGPPTAKKVKSLFENHWLARFPRLLRILHDNGPKFLGHDFQFPLDYDGIKPVGISAHTPTSNSIIESSHKINRQVIQTLLLQYSPTTLDDANVILDEAVATAMHALRCTPNTSLGNFSPGSLVFQRDMFFGSSPHHRYCSVNLYTAKLKLINVCFASMPDAYPMIMPSAIKFITTISTATYFRPFALAPLKFYVFIPTTPLLSAVALLKNVFQFVTLLRFDNLKIPLCGRMNTHVWLVLPSGFLGDSS